MSGATADGNAPASLQGVSIASNGTMSFNYTSGASIAAYDIPLGNVASPDFLTSINGNAFEANGDSGQVFVGAPGTGSFGSIDASSLENSTVDLATELTDMIQAQSASKPTRRCSRRAPTFSTSSTG